ncbi:MAG: hypothetical protein VKK04_07225 [Synechococcales bacterium]|nr:hypothetical protein [Synechococcales bacterium]
MTIFTSKRFEKRQTQAIQKLITFQIQQEWFALPIRLVRKLTLMGPVYGASGNGSTGLTHFENQEIPVIDVQYRIFGDRSGPGLLPRQMPAPPAPARLPAAQMNRSIQQAEIPPLETSLGETQVSESSQRYLLVVQNRQGELVGIPLPSQPVLRRVPESAFAPLPAAYSSGGNLRCVSAIAVLGDDQPSLFLLNLSQLV